MGATVFYSAADELATLTNTFTVSGTPTDPTTVSLTITTPAGVATTYTYGAAQLTRTGTGVYTKDIPCTEADTWQYVWDGTGAASDVTAGTWTVQSTALRTLYCTPETLKSKFGINDNVDDFEILEACAAISRGIEGACDDRWFYRSAQTRVYAASDPYLCRIDDLVSVTSLKTDADGDGTFETTWSTSDYQLTPVNTMRGGESWPYTRIKAVGGRTFPLNFSPNGRDELVQVEGVFGWPQIPAAVRSAALILAKELVKLPAFGVAGFGEFGAVRVRDNPVAMRMLARYQKYAGLVA